MIDVEHHLTAPALDALLPYMSQGWAERFVRAKFALPPAGQHPGGGALPKGQAAPGPREAAAALAPDVSAAILVPHQVMPVAGWADTMLCSVYAAALNDYALEHWLPADPRFRLALAVSPHEPLLAEQEIARHAGNNRVVAVAMPPLATHLGQSHYRPILQAATRHGLPVIVHPSGREGMIIGAPALGGIGPRHMGEYHALIWQVAAVNIASLIFDGTFVDLPDLRVVFAGFGFEWASPTLWHADMEWRNLRIDVPWVSQRPTEILARHVKLVVDDPFAVPAHLFPAIAAAIPDGVLVYGSNAPFAPASASDVIGAFPAGLQAAIGAGNAAATFQRL